MLEPVKLRSNKFLFVLISFIVLSLSVFLGITNNFDNSVTTFFNNLGGNFEYDFIIVVLTSIGDIFTMVIIGIILTVIRRTRKIGMIFLISLVLLSISIMYIKPIVDRTAPVNQYIPNYHLPEKYTIENDSMMPIARDLSYPSNHMARATAFAFILGYWFTNVKEHKFMGSLIWIFPIIIGFTRMYLLQHYFTDILGGFFYGLAISMVLCRLMKIHEPFLINRFR
ncbi:MAG: phosphatase PAP2 family protein [Nitrososphaeraceae archaeon]